MRLTDRQERVLCAVVEEYVATAHAVGSEAVLRRSGLVVSPATIRHEVGQLEDLGLVLQLHTSGGRMPTAHGYRYYIEHLLPTPPLATDEQDTIRHQFHQASAETEEWLKLAAAVIAHQARNVAVVTAPRPADTRVKHLEAISVQAHAALLVVVMTDGKVLQQTVTLDQATPQDELSAASDILNRAIVGRALVEADAQIEALPPRLQHLGRAVLAQIRRASGRGWHVYHEGLVEMLHQPEFSESRKTDMSTSERLCRIIDFLQRGLAIEDLLAMMALENGVQVVVGGEHMLSDLRDYSLVIGRYGDDEDGAGVLGVLGPQRMEYGRAISLVRYMTDLMTDLLFSH